MANVRLSFDGNQAEDSSGLHTITFLRSAPFIDRLLIFLLLMNVVAKPMYGKLYPSALCCSIWEIRLLHVRKFYRKRVLETLNYKPAKPRKPRRQFPCTAVQIKRVNNFFVMWPAPQLQVTIEG